MKKNPVGRQPLFPKFKYERIDAISPSKKIVIKNQDKIVQFAQSIRNYAIRKAIKVSVIVIGNEVHVTKLIK